LKIAQVIDTLQVGGAEMLVLLLCRLHRQAGHEPSVHCLARHGPVGEMLAGEGFPVYTYGTLWRWRLAVRLYLGFRVARPQVVHCHNAWATVVAAPSAWAAGVPAIVSTRHGLVPPPHPWRREVQFSLASRFCSAVVGVCEATRCNLAAAPLADVRKLVAIYNGALPAPSTPAGPLPRKTGFTLLWVGRLAEPKAPATVLRALALARAQVPGLALWVAGDGALRPGLEALGAELGLASAVTFLGERRDVGALLAAADLFVLASESEGLPVSLLEAMAAGRPLLTTDIGAMPEIIQAAGAGRVVPVGEVEALATAIVECARNPEQLVRWGEAARSCYQRQFTPERMAQRYLELYWQGLEKSGTAALASRVLR